MGIIFNFKCLRKRELISSGFIIGHYWIECFGKVLKQSHNTFLTKHVIFLLDFFSPEKCLLFKIFLCTCTKMYILFSCHPLSLHLLFYVFVILILLLLHPILSSYNLQLHIIYFDISVNIVLLIIINFYF